MGKLQALTLKLAALAVLFSPSSYALFGCKTYTREFCKKNLRVLELKREMKLFHWFSSEHYSPQQTADDYVQETLANFLKNDRGVAMTGGLYVATDPTATCSYSGASYSGPGKGDETKARLAVVTLPVGTRVAVIPKFRSVYAPPFMCSRGELAMLRLGKECLLDNGLTVFAYPYSERWDRPKERDAFEGDSVAFTLGQEAITQKGASVKIYSRDELVRRDSFEAAAIARSFDRYDCRALGLWKLHEDARYKDAELKNWIWEHMLGYSGSREFFNFKEAPEKSESSRTEIGSEPGLGNHDSRE